MTLRDTMFLLGGACGGALTFLFTFLTFAMMTVGKRADEETERIIEALRVPNSRFRPDDDGICDNE